MKFSLCCLLIIATTFESIGQVDQKSMTLEVVGTSTAKIKPDLGVLNIAIESKSLIFKDVIVHLNDRTKDVSRQLVAVGFEETDIKTTEFSVSENEIYRDDKSVDSGYVAIQHVVVKFKNQKEIITKILNTFSKSQTDFKLSIDFELSDAVKVKVQKELIQRAILDSKEKADLISKTAMVKLKRIKEIKYGADYYGGMRKMFDLPPPLDATLEDKSITGFTPNDLYFQDKALIIWEIE